MRNNNVAVRVRITPAPIPHVIANAFVKMGINIVGNITSPKLKIVQQLLESY